jgi:plastocyanin domain-containing protein
MLGLAARVLTPGALLVALLGAGCKPSASAPPSAPTAAPGPSAAPVAAYAARVEVAVTDQGFVPGRIPARAGAPLTLVVTRKTDQTCAREIVFAGVEGKTELPLGKPVEVTYTPKVSGEVKFGCAMGMMVGGVLAVTD